MTPRCAGSAVAALVLAACSAPDGTYFGKVADHPDPHHLRWCNAGEPDHLDPALASAAPSIPLVNALFVGLTAYGPDGLPVPSLATRWETSADQRVFTFHLRDDARWSNGRAVTAYDVAFTAFRVVDPLTGSPNGDNIAPVVNAAAYLQRQVYALRRAIGPARAGEVVTLVDLADPPPLATRTSRAPLALHDLGGAAYATVPAGADVTLLEQTGGRATPPSPDGRPWAYVFWPRDRDGVYGWVPAAALDGEPARDIALRVRTAGGAIVQVHAGDLAPTTDVLGIDIPDPHTIIFTCTDPTPFFVPLTANRALRTSPIEAVSRSPRHWTDPDRIVTSGPMTLTAWRERDVVELARSPSYWDQREIAVDRISAYSIDDQAAATNLYVTGACDALASNNIPSSYLPVLAARHYADYTTAPYLGIYFAWLNTKALANRHLRRALALAIDRTQIPRFTHGGEIPTAQLTPGTPITQLSPADLALCGVTHATPGVALIEVPGQVCYVPPPGLDYDPAAAAREVATARAELGAAFPTTIEYRYNAGAEAHKAIAEYLQAQWAAVGITVTLQAQEFNALLADTAAGRFEIARLGNVGTIADTESDFLPLFACGAPDNRAAYCEPAFDHLMAAARAQPDRAARNQLLRAAEAQMLGDAPVIPLYVYTQKHLIKPYVHGLATNLIDQPSLWRVSIDPGPGP